MWHIQDSREGKAEISKKKKTQLVSWIPINVQYPCIVPEKYHVTYSKVFGLNGWVLTETEYFIMKCN